MSDVDFMLHRATQAADLLKAHLREIAGDDEDAIRDTVEGEVDLAGVLALAAAENVKDLGLVEGLKTLIRDLGTRKKRIEDRIALRRVAMLAAMQAGELRKVETPAGTLSRKATPPSLLVLEESSIPAKFWRPSDPVLDKKAVADAIDAGETVPGAMMSNGGETIAIRV